MKKILSIICAIICAFGVTSCSNKTNSGKISVFTSFYAMLDFAYEIGGDRIDLVILCPPGTEPHDYEPTAQDMAKISEGDVFIYNGLGMEAWADSVLEAIGNRDIIAVNTSDNVEQIANLHEDSDEHTDLHIWLNPANAYLQMEAIADAFIQADPDNKDYYTERLANCKEKIDTLIADYESAVAQFTSKDIITSHEAYSSLCNAFNLTQIALNGSDNSQEPTPARIAEITDYIKTNNIKYIFTEPLGTSDIVNSVAKDTGCEVLILDPFEGNPKNNENYFTVMEKNLEALKTALK